MGSSEQHLRAPRTAADPLIDKLLLGFCGIGKGEFCRYLHCSHADHGSGQRYFDPDLGNVAEMNIAVEESRVLAVEVVAQEDSE